MRIVVYGAGGIGGVIGARLFESGHDVALIARGAHLEAIQANGLRIDSATGSRTLPVPVVGHPRELDLDADDVVVLAMKSQDTVGALEALVAVRARRHDVVCAQNGVANERAALRVFANVYGMCVMCPTGHLEPGVVEAYSSPVTGLLDVGRYPAWGRRHGRDDCGRARGVNVQVRATRRHHAVEASEAPDESRQRDRSGMWPRGAWQ